ncbi:integrase core domain-containing protein [Leptospirillum ferriphilum]
MERFHKTLKSECVRTQAPGGFEEDRKIIRACVYTYNRERLPSALNYLI